MSEPRYSLLTGPDSQLRLDPSILAQIRALEARLDSKGIGNKLSLTPTAQTLLNIRLQQALASAPSQTKPLVPRGAGPDKPRPAELSDLLKALMGVPAVKSTVDRAKSQALGQLKRDWNRLPTGGKAAVISQSVIIGGGALTGLMANKQSRQKALEFIQDKQIPVPGLDGVSFQVSPVGQEKKFMIHLDIAALARSAGN